MQSANKWLIGVTSATLLSATAMWEGTRYYAYKDIGGIPTVCQGYTGKGIIFGKKYTPEECNTFLRKELVTHGNGILACVTKPLKENEYNAFVLFAYNVGVNGACNSQAIKQFNLGNSFAGCSLLAYGPHGQPNWSYVNGTFVQGLHNRRKYERAMCLGIPNA